MIEFFTAMDPELQAALVVVVLSILGSIAGKTANPLDNAFVEWLKARFKN